MPVPAGKVSSEKEREAGPEGRRGWRGFRRAPGPARSGRSTRAPVEGLQEDVPSHGVHDHVHAAAARQPPHGLLQAAPAVVHAGLCAPPHGQLALLVASSCSYHLRKEHSTAEAPGCVLRGARTTGPTCDERRPRCPALTSGPRYARNRHTGPCVFHVSRNPGTPTGLGKRWFRRHSESPPNTNYKPPSPEYLLWVK